MSFGNIVLISSAVGPIVQVPFQKIKEKNTHICIVFMYKKKEKIHRNEEKGRGEEICVENIIGAMYASL